MGILGHQVQDPSVILSALICVFSLMWIFGMGLSTLVVFMQVYKLTRILRIWTIESMHSLKFEREKNGACVGACFLLLLVLEVACNWFLLLLLLLLLLNSLSIAARMLIHINNKWVPKYIAASSKKNSWEHQNCQHD